VLCGLLAAALVGPLATQITELRHAQVRRLALESVRELGGAAEEVQLLALNKKGTVKVQVNARPPTSALYQALPQGDALLLDNASGAR